MVTQSLLQGPNNQLGLGRMIGHSAATQGKERQIVLMLDRSPLVFRYYLNQVVYKVGIGESLFSVIL